MNYKSSVIRRASARAVTDKIKNSIVMTMCLFVGTSTRLVSPLTPYSFPVLFLLFLIKHKTKQLNISSTINAIHIMYIYMGIKMLFAKNLKHTPRHESIYKIGEF